MAKIVIVALALTLLLLGFSGVVFAFDVPVWLPIVLIVLAVVLVSLLAAKVSKKMRKERHRRVPGGSLAHPRLRDNQYA